MECYLGCPFSEGLWSSVLELWLWRATGELLEGQILVACHCPVKPTEKSQTQGPVRGKLLGSYWVCAKSLEGSSNKTISLPSRSLYGSPEDLRLESQVCICHLISPRPEPRLGLTYVGCDLSQWSVTTRNVKYFVLCPV